MPRSGEQARERLEQAALDLYAERGFDRTTTAEIAARAGVTERTFFRHFADKREVFFNAETSLRESLQTALADVRASATPRDVMLGAFRAMVPILEDDRAVAAARRRVITATPALRERELAKAAALAADVADELRARGVEGDRARLFAEVGTAALGHAVRAWMADPRQDLDAMIVDAFTALRELTSSRRSVRGT